DSAIWGRAGAVVVPRSGNLLVATGNAPWDGRTNWGDAVVVLSAKAKLVGNYTPTNTEQLNSSDLDLGSTSPVYLTSTLIAQGGTSPVVAGGLLWVYDPGGAGLRVYRPASGKLVAMLSAGSGHWNSPIVIDGRVALPEGDANHHATSGVLDIWRLREA